jgi:hypothetical protein
MTRNDGASSAPAGQQSKMGAAREQTAATGQRARQAGSNVAQGAVSQGRETAAEGARQARNLLGQASEQVRQQAGAQQKHAAQRLRTLGDELQSMSGQAEPGMASDLTRQASARAHQAADWLEQREPGAMVEEVRDYARRHPGMFLAATALAGVLAGRLTRNLTGGGAGGGGAGGGGAGGGGAGDGRGPRGTGAPMGTSMATTEPDGRTGQRDVPLPTGYPRDEVGR